MGKCKLLITFGLPPALSDLWFVFVLCLGISITPLLLVYIMLASGKYTTFVKTCQYFMLTYFYKDVAEHSFIKENVRRGDFIPLEASPLQIY